MSGKHFNFRFGEVSGVKLYDCRLVNETGLNIMAHLTRVSFQSFAIQAVLTSKFLGAINE
jgi:hypothetical protein